MTINPFRNLFYKEKFPFDKEVLMPLLLKAIEVTPQRADYDYPTTDERIQPHTWSQLNDYMVFIKETTDKIWKDWELANDIERYVTSSHINCQLKGQSVREHAHPGVDIVAVGYVYASPGTGNIQFRDPMEYCWQNLPKDTHPRDNWRSIEIETDDVLFFPGFLNHKTEINQTDDPRWTINSMIRSRLFT